MGLEFTLDAATRYNALAHQEGWHSFCSAAAVFENERLCQLFALWKKLAEAAGIPRRRDLTPQLLRPFLADIAIYERTALIDGSLRYRVRVMGARVTEMLGNYNGKFFDEAIPPHFRKRWRAAPEATLEARAPLRFISRVETAEKAFITGEYLMAPLIGDDGALNTVLTGAAFGPTVVPDANL